jgi:cytochrome c5
MGGRQARIAGYALLTLLGGCQKQEAPRAATEAAKTGTPGVHEQLIIAAAMVALPPPGLTGGDLPDPQSQGAKNVAEFCSQCHNIPSPAAHAATDWPSVTRRMWLRMDLLPKNLAIKVPTMQERQVMLDYLIANSLNVSGASLPEGPGRSAFSATCSRCHALPDPRQHSPADWPTVVMRMGRRMDQLKINRPSQEATQAIIGYLNRTSTGTSKK